MVWLKGVPLEHLRWTNSSGRAEAGEDTWEGLGTGAVVTGSARGGEGFESSICLWRPQQHLSPLRS
eukprot:scaffold167898_cov22-Tisochrysis_lutea.AAC.1